MAGRLRAGILLISAIGVFVVLIGSREILGFAANWLFFREVGYEPVFLKTYGIKVLTGLACGAAAFLLLYVNIRIAARLRLPYTDVHARLAILAALAALTAAAAVMGSRCARRTGPDSGST
jgi:uncharacterized membrane protein (UPF0182 family)